MTSPARPRGAGTPTLTCDPEHSALARRQQDMAATKKSDFVDLDPAVQVSTIEVYAPTFSYYNQFPFVDHVLNRLL